MLFMLVPNSKLRNAKQYVTEITVLKDKEHKIMALILIHSIPFKTMHNSAITNMCQSRFNIIL